MAVGGVPVARAARAVVSAHSDARQPPADALRRAGRRTAAGRAPAHGRQRAPQLRTVHQRSGNNWQLTVGHTYTQGNDQYVLCIF